MSTETLSLSDIRALAQNALRTAGATEENAAPLADAVAAAEEDGISSHGLAYIPVYCLHLRCGKVNGKAAPRVSRDKPTAIMVDADHGFAHPAIAAGMELLQPAASDNGIAAMGIRQSYNCGVLGYHTEKIAAAGFVGIGFTNAPASIAPVGGSRPVLGTNPFSVAAPTAGAPFVIDQSASVIAKSEIAKRARAGQNIPDHWALDAEGKPTTDAQAALLGSMLPSGGYKGIGVALLVEMMAAMLPAANLGIWASPFAGDQGGPPATGQFFIAINPDAFGGGAEFSKRLSALCDAITSQDARLQGQKRQAARQQAAQNGVAVEAKLLATVRELGGV